MLNSQLCKIYSQLAENDRKLLGKAMRSPLFNSREELVRLFDFLEKNLPGESSPGRATQRRERSPLTKEAAWDAVFLKKEKLANTTQRAEKQPFNDGKMRHLMAYGLQAIREFLAWKESKNQSANLDLQLCRALKKMGSDTFFEKEHARSLAELEAQPHRSSEYFLFRYQLELEAWEMFRQSQRTGEGNLQQVGATFGTLVAVNTLRQACAVWAQKPFAVGDSPVLFLQETLNLVEAGQFRNEPAVEVYHLSFRALSEPDNVQIFNDLKSVLKKSAAVFPLAELRDIYILAINFCIRRLNAGDKKFIREAFDLYREGLERKVFLENGHLSRFTYRNILNLALGLGEWDWSFDYLHEFRDYLPPRERDNIFRYNLATYFFRKPDYDRALELLRHVEFREVVYNFDARRMLLRIYFDRRELQALDSLLESFATYLRRHRDAGYHREMYQNLVRFARRLIQLPDGDRAAAQKLKTDIEKEPHVAEREWLLSVIG